MPRFEARSAAIQKSGYERIILWGIREFSGDKIASSAAAFPSGQTHKRRTFSNANIHIGAIEALTQGPSTRNGGCDILESY